MDGWVIGLIWGDRMFRPRDGTGGGRAIRLTLVAGLLVGAPGALAQGVAKPDEPEVQPGTRSEQEITPKRIVKLPARDEIQPAEGVTRLLAQAYLTDEERKDLRVFHGLWTGEDLDTPARRAAAAISTGRWDDPSLSDPAVPADVRAEAMLARGEIPEALELLNTEGAAPPTPRVIRLRAQTLEAMGRSAEAAKEIEPLAARWREKSLTSAEELTETARALMIRARTSAHPSPAGSDFRAINTLLAETRDRVDRLDWRVPLAEASLLSEHDNAEQGQEAAAQALALNPRCVAAWYLIGRIAVDGFAFTQSDRIAQKIEELAGEGNPYSAILRAKAAMRQSDPDGASGALASALARYPRMTTLRGVEVAIAALRYDWASTQMLLDRIDETSPGAFDAVYEVGKTLADARQYAESDRFLKIACERAPFRAEPRAERGLMLVQAGRDADARAALTEALALDPFNARATNTLKLVEELAGYKTFQSEHFTIRCKPGADEILAAEMPLALEPMYARVTGKGPGGIDHEPSAKTTIDLMPDSRWFAVRIAGVTRIHTMAASTGPCIAMETPRVGPGHSVGTYDWLRVVRHEFTHTVTLSRTKNRIPHWFTEAAAVYLEDAPRDYPTITLMRDVLENDALFDLREINVAFVRPRKPSDRAQAYAQGHMMYEYMISRWGEGAPLRLMDRYAAGDREDAAMQSVLGIEPKVFLADFSVWARQKLAGWGVATRSGEPTIAEVLHAEAIGTAEAREALKAKVRERATGGAITPSEDGPPGAAKPPELTIEIIDRWLAEYPESPDLLERRIKARLAQAKGTPTPDLVPLLDRYAAARPVDPLPHQLLLKLDLAKGEGASADAISHLEFLDAREQGSATYAAELARAYAANGEQALALAKATRAVTISPYDAALRELAATISIRANDLAGARRHILALTVIEPDRAIHKQRLDAIDAMLAKKP